MIDLAQLFNRRLDVKVNFNGVDLVHRLRDPKHEEDLEFRRRATEMNVKNREAYPTAAALYANVYLYDCICESVSAQDGADGTPQDVPDFKEKIPSDLKIAIINAWLNRFVIIESVKRVAQQKGSE